ncbi:hypothetical protein [Ignatzschineria sp. LJL83]
MKRLIILFTTAFLLTACSRQHPLEAPAQVQLPSVVKVEDYNAIPVDPIGPIFAPDEIRIDDNPSKYYIH